MTSSNLEILSALLNLDLTDRNKFDGFINVIFDENFSKLIHNKNLLKMYQDYFRLRLFEIEKNYEYKKMREDFQNNGTDVKFHPEEELELSSYSNFKKGAIPSTPLSSPTKSTFSDSGYTSPDHEDETVRQPPIRSVINRKKSFRMMCMFCKKNGERNMVVLSHNLKDKKGRITCPVLRNYICPLCGKSGDDAHTLSYCSLYVPRIFNDKEFDKLVNDSNGL